MSETSEDKRAPFGYCTQCGEPLQVNAKFCVHCGAPTTDDQDNNESNSDEALPNSNDPSSDLAEGNSEDGATNKISVDEVIAAEQAAERSVEETSRISSVADSPTVPQSGLIQDEATTRIPISDQPTLQYQAGQASRSPFTPGDTAELPVAETLRQTAHQGVSYSAENTSSEKQGNGKKIALVVGGVVIAIAAALVIAVFGFGLGSPAQEQASDSAEQTQEQAEQQIVVELTKSYSTKFASENSVTYPTFSFKYPASWSITNELITARGETVELTSSDGAVITYDQRAQSTSSADSVSLDNMEKVANAAFVPTAVQGSDYSDLGDFMVAKGDLIVNGRSQGMCYALVPVSAMHSTMDLDLRCGVPGFWYASTITFTCIPPEGISEQTEQEIIAILASFTESSAAPEPEDENTDNNDVTTISGDYVLPDSSSRTYSESELKELTNYELYIARNEIFARHGRMFNNEDLQDYFGSKSWYHPSVKAEDFDESVFNSHEKKNIETMAKIENSRGSKFVS